MNPMDEQTELTQISTTSDHALFRSISKDLSHVHMYWKVYRQLFAATDRRIELLNETGSLVFHILQHLLINEVTLAICRLTDPVATGGHENHSLERLLRDVEDEHLLNKLRDQMALLRPLAAPFRDRRNRAIAHSDLNSKLQFDENPLPGISRQTIEDTLKSIRDFMNAYDYHYFHNTHLYEEVTLALGSDGDFLTQQLQRAVALRDMERAGAIQREVWSEGRYKGSVMNNWPTEFARIISCSLCTAAECRNLLRDDGEHVPQPGYIGSRYAATRLLLVGQNPGVDTVGLAARDRVYTAALRELSQNPSAIAYRSLNSVMEDFVPSWPVHGSYFPLRECGLTLQDIAYYNAVRCRTVGNALPSKRQARNCIDTHFRRWLDLLKPRAVVFIGKWAFDQCGTIVLDLKIPSAFMNRQRSLSNFERTKNRQEVVTTVKGAIGR